MPGFSTFRPQLTGEVLKERRELFAIWKSHHASISMRQRYCFTHFQPETSYHLTLSWDASSGEFACYLDGYLIERTHVQPWQIDTAINGIHIELEAPH